MNSKQSKNNLDRLRAEQLIILLKTHTIYRTLRDVTA